MIWSHIEQLVPSAAVAVSGVGEVCLGGGVSALGGVPGGCLPRGVSAWGCLSGV